MLQVKNSVVNTVSGATLLGVIAITSVTNCNATNTISPTFTTTTGIHCVSGDATATGSGSQTNLTPDYRGDGSYEITQTWANANLVGKGYNSGDIASWNYFIDLPSTGFELLETLTVPDLAGATASSAVLTIPVSELSSATITKLKSNFDDLLVSTDVHGTELVPLHIVDATTHFKIRVQNIADGMAIRLFGNNASAVQPLATDPLGSQAVHQDKVFNLELANGSGSPVDSSGKTTGWTSGSSSYNSDGIYLTDSQNLRNATVHSDISSDNTYRLSFMADLSTIASGGTVVDVSGGYSLGRSGSTDNGRITFTNGTRGTGSGFVTALTDGNGLRKYDIVFDGGSHRVYRDGVYQWHYGYGVNISWESTIWFFNGVVGRFKEVAFSNNSATPAQVKIEADNANGNWWISDAAVGSLNTVTMSVSQPTFTSSASNTVPINLGSVSFTRSSPTFASNGSTTVSSNSATVIMPGQQPGFTSSGSNTVPYNIGSATFTVSQGIFSVSGSTSEPLSGASVTIDLSVPTFASTGSNTVPVNIATGSMTSNPPSFGVTGSSDVPYNVMAGSFSVARPSFDSAGNTYTGSAASVDFTIQVPQFSASGEVTNPRIAGVNLGINQPSFASSAGVINPRFATVSMQLTQPTFNGVSTVSLPPVLADIYFTGNQPTFNLTADTTVPTNGVSVSININQPTFYAKNTGSRYPTVTVSGSYKAEPDELTAAIKPTPSITGTYYGHS